MPNERADLVAVGGAREALASQRVFGEVVERDGVTVIPAALVQGGGGGGGGTDSDGDSGGGGGFGVRARPVGAYVIRDGTVRWEPAWDLTRVAIIGQLTFLIVLFVIRSVSRSRARRRRLKRRLKARAAARR